MINKLIKIQPYIESDILNIAKNYAKMQKIPLSQYIREAIKAYNYSIKIKYKKSIIIPLNFGPKTPTDIANTHNDIHEY